MSVRDQAYVSAEKNTSKSFPLQAGFYYHLVSI